MKSIFVIVESMNYEKYVLFNYPLSKDFFNYLKKKYSKSNKDKNANINNLEEEDSNLELYLKLFTLDNHVNQDFIFDIIIDNDRFISFPIWLSKNEYNRRALIEKEYDAYVKNKMNFNKAKSNVNKTIDKYFLLNMFNIVFIFSNDKPMNINRELFKSVYSNLESLSKLLLFEEYNKHYLGDETLRIIKLFQKFFIQKKENILYEDFIEKFSTNNNIYTYIKNIYEGIKKNEISNVMVGNIELNYYISMYTNQLNNFKIKPYHSIIINNRKKLNKFFQSDAVINPKILIIIDKIFQMKTLEEITLENNTFPLKTLEEISLENNIELNFVLFFASQLVSWNLANIIFKFNNYSTFQISDSIPDIIKLNIHEKFIGFNQAINILNKFTTSESTTTLNEIYQTNFKSIDNDAFKRYIIYFVENQYLIQTSIIIISKLKMKDDFNYQNKMINQFSELTSRKYIFDIQKNINKNKIEENKENSFYYEDFLKLVKKESMEDFIFLSNIKDLISQRLFINEISYYTGYKIKDILSIVQKYDAIFDLLVVPLYNNK